VRKPEDVRSETDVYARSQLRSKRRFTRKKKFNPNAVATRRKQAYFPQTPFPFIVGGEEGKGGLRSHGRGSAVGEVGPFAHAH